MKISRFFGIVPLLLAGLCILIYSCESEESSLDKDLQLVDSKSKTDEKNKKIDVCHNGHTINVSINALGAHQGHGDAIDLDGDGYFDIDNSCSETDCDDDDPYRNPGIEGSCDEGQGTAELLVGTWTTTEIDIISYVGSQTLMNYLVDVVGLTPEEAEAKVEMFENNLVPEVTGSLTIYPDNTYESAFAGGSDSGTWNLSADEMTLTLFEGPDTIVITINSISESLWYATLSEDYLIDLDDDPTTADVNVTVIANVVLTK
jgi:hypothetical protein